MTTTIESQKNRRLYRTLVRVALPIAAQSLISSTLNLVDNLMVGSLGETELAAVGIATQLFFVHWMLMFGFTSGTATFMAQFWGAGDLPRIRKTIGLAVAVCQSFSLLFFGAAVFAPRFVLGIFTDAAAAADLGEPYLRICGAAVLMVGFSVPFTAALRATQQTHLPLMISIFVFSTNTFLNYIFIFGHLGAPRLGVTGAAVGTLSARTLEMLLVIFVVFVRKNRLAAGPGAFFGWSRDFFLRVIRNAVPTTVNETMWGLGTSLYAAAYARMGITAFAAVQASNTINYVFILMGFSIGDAALILVGQKLGEGNPKAGRELAGRLLEIGVKTGALLGLLLILLSGPLTGLFQLTEAGRAHALRILLIYGLTMGIQLYTGINIVGVLRAGGDTRFAMMTECLSVWLAGVPLAFLGALVWQLPVYWVAALIKIEELVKLAVLRRRFRSGKWAKNVIGGL